MKNWTWSSFIIGIIVGLILTVGTINYIGHKTVTENINTNKTNNIDTIPGLTLLKENEKGSIFDTKSIKVMQTLSAKMALAHTSKISEYTKELNYYGTLVLYIANDNVMLYDDQVIEIPNGKQLIQVGTFKYETKNKTTKTVPAVSIK